MTLGGLMLVQFKEVMDFMEKNHRNPSKHYPKEKLKHNWIHHNRKMMNKGEMKPERLELLQKRLEMGEKYRRVNHYI